VALPLAVLILRKRGPSTDIRENGEKKSSNEDYTKFVEPFTEERMPDYYLSPQKFVDL